MTDSAVSSSPPRTLRWALWASIAWAALTVAAALALLTQKSWLHGQLISGNTKAKSPRANYTGSVVDQDVDRVANYGVIQAIVVAAIIVAVAVFVGRGRPWARWLLVGFATIIPLIVPLGIGILGQLYYGLAAPAPVAYKAPLILAGLASLAVVVILFLPETRAYFVRMRPEGRSSGLIGRQARGAGPRGGAPTGLGGLFGSRRSVAGSQPSSSPPAGSSSVREQPAPAIVTRPSAAKARAVTRPGSLKPKGGARSKSRQR